jgi:hypothetical protein
VPLKIVTRATLGTRVVGLLMPALQYSRTSTLFHCFVSVLNTRMIVINDFGGSEGLLTI